MRLLREPSRDHLTQEDYDAPLKVCFILLWVTCATHQQTTLKYPTPQLLLATSLVVATHVFSFLPEKSMTGSPGWCHWSEKYQKPHVLVAKLLMRFIIFTRTTSGPYAISWLECRQTNMFDAKTVILYWTSNITNVHSTTVLLCQIRVDPLMGTSQPPVQVHWRLHVEHYGKGTTWVNMDAHWLGPLGMPTRHIAHTSLGGT